MSPYDALRLELETAMEEIRVLRAGECRFHCRTTKDNWIDGFQRCDDQEYTRAEVGEFYDEWKRQHPQTG